jgi:transketolase C-terminal domain/subunit
VAEIYAEHPPKRVERLGIPDTFTESDDCSILRDAYGLSLDDAAQAVRRLLALSQS